MSRSWKLISVAAIAVVISTTLQVISNPLLDPSLENLLFYLQYPGYMCTLLAFGVHGGSAHEFEVVTIFVNTLAYWLIGVALLWLLSEGRAA